MIADDVTMMSDVMRNKTESDAVFRRVKAMRHRKGWTGSIDLGRPSRLLRHEYLLSPHKQASQRLRILQEVCRNPIAHAECAQFSSVKILGLPAISCRNHRPNSRRQESRQHELDQKAWQYDQAHLLLRVSYRVEQGKSGWVASTALQADSLLKFDIS